jgi:hypothetical protein
LLATACLAPGEESVSGPYVKPRPAALCEPKLTIGTGRTSFVPLADGDSVDLMKGSGQAWFFSLALQARGLDPAHGAVCYRGTLLPEGRELGFQCWKVQFTTDLADGWHERLGLMANVYPDYWNAPAALDGHSVRLEVYAGDNTDCAITGEVTMRLSVK